MRVTPLNRPITIGGDTTVACAIVGASDSSRGHLVKGAGPARSDTSIHQWINNQPAAEAFLLFDSVHDEPATSILSSFGRSIESSFDLVAIGTPISSLLLTKNGWKELIENKAIVPEASSLAEFTDQLRATHRLRSIVLHSEARPAEAVQKAASDDRAAEKLPLRRKAFSLAQLGQTLSQTSVAELPAALQALSPDRKIILSSLYYWGLGDFALSTDLYLRRRQIQPQPDHELRVFLTGEPSNRQLLTMFSRYIPIIENERLFQETRSDAAFQTSGHYEPVLTYAANELETWTNTKPIVRFTPEEEHLGQHQLRAFGLGEDDWFVTVFSRDAAYKKFVYPDHAYENDNLMRNADIDTFQLAMLEIVERGGYVFRMGYKVEKPLSIQHPRIIDYATIGRSDFMDVYLTAKAKFVLGMTSGIVDLSYVFGTPRLNVNHTPVGATPFAPNSLYIPKKVAYRENGQPASFRRVISEFRNRDHNFYNALHQYERGYEYVPNTAEEILDATREMFARLDGSFQETAEDRQLLRSFYELYPADHLNANCHVPVARNFLRNNQDYFFS